MDAKEFRLRGKEIVDYLAEYHETIRDRRVFPEVQPGYMRPLVPAEAPDDPEDFRDIVKDVEKIIMPGMTHWQSPYMHAYFPALNSYPALLGDFLATGLNCIGFTWASSPACTELEVIVMDWLGKMLGLPEEFLHTKGHSPGGGVIQTTCSESTFVCLLAGRTEAIKRHKQLFPDVEDAVVNSRLVAYCSDQAHSSVEKAGLIGLVKIRYLETDENLSLRGDKLKAAVEYDRSIGLIPFFLCATLGTTGACAFDNLLELGPICQEEEIWLHIDAAYAGSAFLCPEFRDWMKGIEYANSFAMNPAKWMLVNFDCTAMWVKNSRSLHRTFNVEPLYLKHENTGLAIDYMHWQVPLSRKFRSLKLWFVIRNYGVKGLQSHIRKGVALAKEFEALVASHEHFEMPAKRHLGLVVFRLKGDNSVTESLLKKINSSGHLHVVPASLKGQYVIRFTVTSQHTTSDDIRRDWAFIKMFAEELIFPATNVKMKLKDIRERNSKFGTSLILANIGPNSPMTPKIIDGSYAALVDRNDVITEVAKKIEELQKESGWSGVGGTKTKEGFVWGPKIPPAIGFKKQRQLSLDSKSLSQKLLSSLVRKGDGDEEPDEKKQSVLTKAQQKSIAECIEELKFSATGNEVEYLQSLLVTYGVIAD